MLIISFKDTVYNTRPFQLVYESISYRRLSELISYLVVKTVRRVLKEYVLNNIKKGILQSLYIIFY